MGFSYERELPSPEHLKELLPVSPQLEQIRLDRIDYIKKILSGDYERLLLIIGPCSA
ncbi:MAG TPA: 3-deoxy-7-phosphoheptulonate synthase, partial [Lachnospiraceae bacterium]|nr:3-deoxy-7-phosphoheptulonate synthase [Lachnospiraceae bacterium]